MSEILLSFLKNNLYEIGDNDEKLKNLSSAVKAVSKNLKGDPGLIASYTLIAMDPNVPTSNSVIVSVEETITEYWKTLRSKFSETPRTLIRSVILQALYDIGSEEAVYARAIYLIASDLYPHVKLNREKEIIDSLLLQLGTIAEKYSNEEWGIIENGSPLKLPTLKTELKNPTLSLNQDKLREALVRAANRPAAGYNPYQHPAEWANHFAGEATTGITGALTETINGINKAISPAILEEPINKFFADFKKNLDVALKSTLASVVSIERRTKLLWWKETLYSPALKKSYREVDSNILPALMATDLNDQVPEITPESVDFLLTDTLFTLLKDTDELVEINTLIMQFQKNKDILRSIITEIELKERVSLAEFLSAIIHDKAKPEDLFKSTGIKGSDKLTQRNVSVLLFHNLLINRLLEQ